MFKTRRDSFFFFNFLFTRKQQSYPKVFYWQFYFKPNEISFSGHNTLLKWVIGTLELLKYCQCPFPVSTELFTSFISFLNGTPFSRTIKRSRFIYRQALPLIHANFRRLSIKHKKCVTRVKQQNEQVFRIETKQNWKKKLTNYCISITRKHIDDRRHPIFKAGP